MSTSRFLAFDFGAESGRAILATIDAGKISLRELHRFPSHNGRLQGTFQWNLVALWEDIKAGLRAAAQTGERIDGIGVDTWGVDFGLLDANGRVIGNPVHYRDARTDGALDAVFAVVPRDKVFAATGIQFMQLNTLFQLFALTRSGWPLEGAAKRLLFMPDLFHYLLSGRAANELTIASTSQMLDPRTRTWNLDLLKSLGIPAHWLGEIVPPGTKLGGLLPDIAAETGLPAGTPIIAPATHDTASAVAAVPVAEGTEGWCYLSSGTWSLMGVESPVPVVDERTLKANFTNEQGANNQVRLLKNIMGLWLVQETRRDLIRRAGGKADGFDYATLTKLAAEAEPLRTVLDPWHAPFAAPGDFLNKIETHARQTGQSVPSTPGQYVRACLDSLALAYRLVLETLEELTGKPITTVHIVGGGTKNELLSQLTADATRRRVVAGPVEATALGNAITQALGLGVIPSLAAGRKLIADSFELQTFTPKNPTAFDTAYAKFKQIATP